MIRRGFRTYRSGSVKGRDRFLVIAKTERVKKETTIPDTWAGKLKKAEASEHNRREQLDEYNSASALDDQIHRAKLAVGPTTSQVIEVPLNLGSPGSPFTYEVRSCVGIPVGARTIAQSSVDYWWDDGEGVFG